MAGDWIKMRSELQSHPKVVRILSATHADKFRVIGGLHAVWSVFDMHSSGGSLFGYTPETMDHVIGWDGFSDALIAVKWLIYDGAETLTLPEFDEHNSQSAKRRAEDQKRKRDARRNEENSPDKCGQNADKKRTREEKRREEQEIPSEGASDDLPADKKGKGKTTAVSLKAWIESLDGEDAIPGDDPIYAYADSINLPDEFIALAWSWFKDAMATKRQADWRRHFRNAVKGNWPKYWWPTDDGGWRLSPAGEQAKRAAEAMAA